MSNWCQSATWKLTSERSTRRNIRLFFANIATILRNMGLKCRNIENVTKGTWYFVTSVSIKLPLHICWDSTKIACMIPQNIYQHFSFSNLNPIQYTYYVIYMNRLERGTLSHCCQHIQYWYVGVVIIANLLVWGHHMSLVIILENFNFKS